MNLGERIDVALHPERNGLKMKGIAEGASHEHVVKADIHHLIRDVLDEVVPPRPTRNILNDYDRGYSIGSNTIIDELEYNRRELGL